MMTMEPQFSTNIEQISLLLAYMHEISDLNGLHELAMFWDQHTALPEQASEIRGAQLATQRRLLKERSSDLHLGSLLERLEEERMQEVFTDADRGLIRVARRLYRQATKLPGRLIEETARVEAQSLRAWNEARTRNDFAYFAPWLSRMVALKRETADYLGWTETRYDALLDLYEPGLTVGKLDALFAPLHQVIAGLLQRVQASGNSVDTAYLSGHFPKERQFLLCRTLLRRMGFDSSRGQVGQSQHPFTTGIASPFDVRLTLRAYEESIQEAIIAALHEGGHAVYAQGCAAPLARTPLCAVSLGLDESQARLWECMIGRSMHYWKGHFASVQAIFPDRYAQGDAELFARALNSVKPGPIRAGSDELTYNLHIFVRYDLEKALINGELSVEAVPSLWRAKYRDYLSVTPTTDVEGVLQDDHWTTDFGYFPTYTLGNLYAAQISAAMHRAFADFDQRLANGETDFLLKWLRKRMYLFGGIYLPEELIERVTGEKPDPASFVDYLTGKFEALYNLSPVV